MHRTARRTLCQIRDGGRIDPRGEEDRERNVADQVQPDTVHEHLGKLLLVQVVPRRGRRDVPEAFATLCTTATVEHP